jgi:HEAT repeat protein
MTAVLGMSARERERAAEAEALFERRATADLVDRLTDPSWLVRRAVVSALSRLGDEAIEPLIAVLTGDRRSETSIAAAVDALVSSLGHVEEAALRLARSPNTAISCDGAQILGRRRAVSALPELAHLAHSDNDNVALSALEAVGRIGGEPAVDLFIEAVESRSFFRAFPAIDLLGRTGDPRAVRPLAGLLRHPHYALEAVRALGRTGQPGAVPLLAELLTRPSDADVRIAAVSLVEIHDRYAGRFGATSAVPSALRTVDAASVSRRLAHAATDADSGERSAISRVLGWIGGAPAIHALVGLLDADPETARAAAASLASLERSAEPELLRALRTSGSERRLLLLPIVGRRSSATTDVIACLDDPNPNVRALACEALGRIGDASAVPVLFERLGDADARVSQGAVAAIQAMGGTEVERRAVELARTGGARARRPALRILAYFGSVTSLPLFLEGMADPDDRVRDVAANGLAAVDHPRALAALLEASHHGSSRTRATAVRALGQSDATEPVRARLLETLQDPDAWVRYYAVQALSRIGGLASAEPIAGLLHDAAGHVRVAAIDALARLRGDQSLEALHEALGSDDADVVRAALMGLGIVRSASSFPLLGPALHGADAATRLVAVSALAEFDVNEVVDELAKAAFDPSESVRAAAINLLGSRPGPDATRALVGLLGDEGSRDRVAAALTTYVAGRVEGIVAALDREGPETAAILVGVLARMRRPEAQLALEHAFALENVHARRAVAPALSPDITPRGRALLEQGAKSDPDEHVRRLCAAILRG